MPFAALRESGFGTTRKSRTAQPISALRRIADVAASLRVILHALQQQREAERDVQINYFDASSRLLKLRCDVVPDRISAVIFR
jgi:hypothetical protein